MAKTLCELKSMLKGDLNELMKIVNQPTHICRKCGRAANRKKLLCKPVKIVLEETP